MAPPVIWSWSSFRRFAANLSMFPRVGFLISAFCISRRLLLDCILRNRTTALACAVSRNGASGRLFGPR
eukprot:11181898-Lingulodinium_polyedra.AAC.1